MAVSSQSANPWLDLVRAELFAARDALDRAVEQLTRGERREWAQDIGSAVDACNEVIRGIDSEDDDGGS